MASGSCSTSRSRSPELALDGHGSFCHFAASGLKASSLIRLGFLVVLPVTRFLGAIGSIAPERRRRLVQRRSSHLAGGREAV